MNYFFILIFIFFVILFFRSINNDEANNNYPIEKIFKIDELKKDFTDAGFEITVENDVLLNILSYIGPLYSIKIIAKYTKNGANIFFKIFINRLLKSGFSILATSKTFEAEMCELCLDSNNFNDLPVYINVSVSHNLIFVREHFSYVEELFEDSLKLQNKIILSYTNKEELEKLLLEDDKKFKIIDFFKKNFVFSITLAWYLIIFALMSYSNYTYNYTLFTFTNELIENYSYIPNTIILIIWLYDKYYKFPYYLGFVISNRIIDSFFLLFTNEIKNILLHIPLLFLSLIINQLIYNFFQNHSYRKHKFFD